ncbi:sulfotransferase 2A1-like isoform X2 [Phascolarctos cinereus]|uniref:Sulfotransferase n=1 Tax=Phascolarctos cinereus TaxID=38626 RepID=A0A6P5LR88_PHACI|nr:bile salt sulfotransferase-like isoform X2 [Phascolarctos cinereus]
MSSEYTEFEGILFYPFYSVKNLKFCQEEFMVKDTDVILVTYPKSGTHWVIEIVSLIRSKGDNTWVQSIPIWNRSPWIETDQGQLLLSKKEQNGPRFYSSHLPIQLFPKSYFHSKAKIIYIMRNPKDVVVSLYYFSKVAKFFHTAESFSQMFEKFTQGTVPFGSWFDHTCGWLSLREKENFLILTYEELLQDLWGNVEKICHFLGTKLTEEEINLVIKNASLSAMKANKMSNYSVVSDEFIDLSQGSVLRKGLS